MGFSSKIFRGGRGGGKLVGKTYFFRCIDLRISIFNQITNLVFKIIFQLIYSKLLECGIVTN